MKRLYVGCRVRVVVALDWPELTGRQARIIGFVSGSDDPWDLDVDGVGSVWPDGKAIAASSDELEPIQDPGHEKVSWEECLWRPEGITA